MKYQRYHCYDSNNEKHIRRVELGQTPQQLPDHTPWVRGTGPHSAEARHNMSLAMKAIFCGVPKSPEQKQKMRDAKLGKPKSLEHIANMKLAQQKRWHGVNGN